MALPNGQSFRVADNNLTFREFGDLVSATWIKGHPDIAMYASGTPTDDLEYPCLTWGCAGRWPTDSLKPRLVDEFLDDEGQGRGKYLQVFRSLFEVQIKARDPRAANQIVEEFERFMLEFIAAFKKAGMGEIIYAERSPDTIDIPAKSTVVIRTVRYELQEQYTYTIKDYIIESIEARTTISDGETASSDEIISTIT